MTSVQDKSHCTQPDRKLIRPQYRGSGPRRWPLDPARDVAFEILRVVSERDAYANLALPALLRQLGVSGRDAAFATELAYGACRTRGFA